VPQGQACKLGRRWGGMLPPGHPVVELCQAERMPPSPSMHGSVIAAERLVEKHLTQNQMFGEQASSHSEQFEAPDHALSAVSQAGHAGSIPVARSMSSTRSKR
jgi:hypothetical protein